MKDYIEIGRMYKGSNLDNEGEKIFTKFDDPTVFYKMKGQWMEYNPLTGKEKKIKF